MSSKDCLSAPGEAPASAPGETPGLEPRGLEIGRLSWEKEKGLSRGAG